MADSKDVVALFVDVRGFTNWSESNEAFANLDYFILGLGKVLRTIFRGYQYKPLGDGAMLVKEARGRATQASNANTIEDVLSRIDRAERAFRQHCEEFGSRFGHSANLELGWGVIRGKVIVVDDDYAGSNLNKCSRLCDEARPFGVVIDQDDFPVLPADRHFTSQIRRLKGIGEVRVWVSRPASNQFLTREQIRETPEVHVAGSIVRAGPTSQPEVLFARRSLSRRLYPGRLEGCGGQLRANETFEDGVRRHFRMEQGIDVTPLSDHTTLYAIREPGVPVIPGVRFLCKAPAVFEPASENHTEFVWMNASKIRRTKEDEFVGNLKSQILELLKSWEK